MKIAIDARLYHESGVGRYISNLIAELARIDTRTTYILFVRPKTELPKLPPNFKPVAVDIGWHSLKEQIVLPFILWREKIDLVHFPYFNVPIWCPCPFVATIHDLIINHLSTGRASTRLFPVYWLKRLCYSFVLQQAVKRAAAIIVPSKATKEELLEHYSVDQSRVHVITEGTLSSSIKERTLPMLGTTERFFLYVGNAYPHKNLERLIDAFVSFRKSDAAPAKGIKLVLVGKRDFFHERLKSHAAASPSASAILFVHDVSDSQLIWLYRHALALVFPSLMEGFGLPAVEAMKEGCVVAASDIASLREVCGTAALYFNPNNTQSIVSVMSAIASLSFAASRMNRMYEGKKQTRRFDWQRAAKETLFIYEHCTSI